MFFFRKIKAFIRSLIDSFYCKNLLSKKQVGSRKADNWFVLTESLSEAVVYSGGVGKDITFEFALANEYGCHIFLFDPSPTGRQTATMLKLPETIRFFPVGLAGKDGILVFGEPVNPEEGSYRFDGDGRVEFECRSISSLMKENSHDQIELLKIDIEGFEYEVVDDIIQNKLKIRQIAVEFHDFYKEIKKSQTKRSIDLLKANGYALIHKRGHDYTFVKADSI